MSKDCRDSAKMSTMQAMKKTHGVMKIDDTAINAHLTTRVTAQKKLPTQRADSLITVIHQRVSEGDLSSDLNRIEWRLR